MIGHDILLNRIFYYKLNYIKCSANSAGLYDDVVFLGRYAGNPSWPFVDILQYGYLLQCKQGMIWKDLNSRNDKLSWVQTNGKTTFDLNSLFENILQAGMNCCQQILFISVPYTTDVNPKLCTTTQYIMEHASIASLGK